MTKTAESAKSHNVTIDNRGQGLETEVGVAYSPYIINGANGIVGELGFRERTTSELHIFKVDFLLNSYISGEVFNNFKVRICCIFVLKIKIILIA